MQKNNQESTPLVSFIIAYYELPVKILRECLDSILALSLSSAEREIILVDDGSENSPVAALADYADDILYLRQSHQGLSVARNTGIRLATGEYLQFIDADDLLLTSPYERCLDLVRFHKYEMVTFCLTNKTGSQAEVTISSPQSGSELMRHQNIQGSACGYIFRRSILGDLRFTPDTLHEDEEFTPQLMLRAESVCATDAKAYLYRRRYNSIITGSHIRQRLRRLNDSKDVIFRLHQIADRFPAEDRAGLQRRIAQLTMDYLYNVIRQTGSKSYLEHRVEELRSKGLFPLPDRNFTSKYNWFRRLSNSRQGRSILLRLIPLLPQER